MKQQTISLDAQSVAVLDELKDVLKIPKAKIIQEALIKLKEQLHNKMVLTKQNQKTEYPILDSLVGSITIKGKGKTNYSERVDDIYLRD